MLQRCKMLYILNVGHPFIFEWHTWLNGTRNAPPHLRPLINFLFDP